MAEWNIGIDFGTSYTYVMGHSNDGFLDGRVPLKRIRLAERNLYEELTSYKGEVSANAFHGIPTIIAREDNEWVIGNRAKKSNCSKYTDLKKDLRYLKSRSQKLTEDNDFKGYKIETLAYHFFSVLFHSIITTEYAEVIGNTIKIEDISSIVVGAPGEKNMNYVDVITEVIEKVIKDNIKGHRVRMPSIKVMEEPILAGYAVLEAYSPGNYMVVDIGGGTTDVAIMQKNEKGKIELVPVVSEDGRLVVSSAGTEPAGKHLTEVLVNNIDKKGWAATLPGTYDAIKERLSFDYPLKKEDNTLCRHYLFERGDTRYWIFFGDDDVYTYKKVSGLYPKIFPNIENINYFVLCSDTHFLEYVDKVCSYADKFAHKSSLKIDYAILIGGSSRLPEFQTKLEEKGYVVAGFTTNQEIDESNAVAVGACIFCSSGIKPTIPNIEIMNNGCSHEVYLNNIGWIRDNNKELGVIDIILFNPSEKLVVDNTREKNSKHVVFKLVQKVYNRTDISSEQDDCFNYPRQGCNRMPLSESSCGGYYARVVFYDSGELELRFYDHNKSELLSENLAVYDGYKFRYKRGQRIGRSVEFKYKGDKEE